MTSRRGAAWLALVVVILAACQSSAPPPTIYRDPVPPPVRAVDEGASSAETLTAGLRTFGSVCEEALARWYRFEVTGRTSNVTLVLDSNPTSSDVDLLLFDTRILSDPAAEAVVVSRGGGGDERIERLLRPGTYYLRVHCYDNKAPTPYTLDLVIPPPVSKEEPKSQAVLLKESSKGLIGAGQRWLTRWYRIEVEERSKLTVNVQPSMTSGQLRFDVQTPKGKVLANVSSGASPRTLTVDLRPGEYFFYLQPEGVGATGSFDFNFALGPSEEAQAEARRAEEQRVAAERRAAERRAEERRREEAARAEQRRREEAQRAAEEAAAEEEAEEAPQPPPRVEAARSTAQPIRSGSAVSVTLGNAEPVAKWFTITVKKKAVAHIRCSGDAPLIVEVFRRGSDQVVSSGLQVKVPVTAGTYDIRVKTPADAARATLDVRVHDRDDDATFEEVDPSKSRD